MHPIMCAPGPRPCVSPSAQAAWLYKATGEESYLSAARGYLKRAQVGGGIGGRGEEGRVGGWVGGERC